MHFGIGSLELVAILMSAAVSVAMFVRRDTGRRWSIAVFGCVTLAAILTPADIFSMLVMASVLFGVYLVGTRHYNIPKLTSA